jgi:hypothetical protein
LDPIPEAFSDEDDEVAEIVGGGGYADVIQKLGVPPPLVDHAAPHGAAPAASIVERALALAPPLPLVRGSPILSKPAKVIIKLRLGFFDVLVFGSLGEVSFFRLPLRRLSTDPGCKGLMVVNLASGSVGLIDSIALVGPLRRPTLAVDVLARAASPDVGTKVPLAAAEAMVAGLGTDTATLPQPDMESPCLLLLRVATLLLPPTLPAKPAKSAKSTRPKLRLLFTPL